MDEDTGLSETPAPAPPAVVKDKGGRRVGSKDKFPRFSVKRAIGEVVEQYRRGERFYEGKKQPVEILVEIYDKMLKHPRDRRFALDLAAKLGDKMDQQRGRTIVINFNGNIDPAAFRQAALAASGVQGALTAGAEEEIVDEEPGENG